MSFATNVDLPLLASSTTVHDIDSSTDVRRINVVDSVRDSTAMPILIARQCLMNVKTWLMNHGL